MAELTKEQEEFLRQCEEEYKDRYTGKDEEFMKIKSAEPKKPPIVDPWYNTPQRSKNNYLPQNQGRDRRNQTWHRHGHDRDRDRDRGRDRDRDRDNRHAGRHHLHQRSYRPY